MLVRAEIEARAPGGVSGDTDDVAVRLPSKLKDDKVSVRTSMMRRMAASRSFALGDRSGVLRAAQNRSGRPFRLDVRQRVIVKAMISRHIGRGGGRAAALAKHIAYLGRDGAGQEGARPEFFDRDSASLDAARTPNAWQEDRHHFRFIISPENGDRIADLKGYAREVMRRVAADLGEPELRWIATCHYDTDQPHAHVLVRGRRADGRDLVIPRNYMGYGFRARAQEVAQERLGDLSRIDAERRVWKETQAERFTSLDRRLVASADGEGCVPDGVGGTEIWEALTRGRLRTLEDLGLAVRKGRRYRLHPDLETRLRSLQMRRDVIRTLNQRRLEGVKGARMLRSGRVRGIVVKAGFHDELGLQPFVVIRDQGGVEYYARLRPGVQVGSARAVSLEVGANGMVELSVKRGKGAER